MKNHNRLFVSFAIGLIFIGIVTYYLCSPYITVYSIKQSIVKRDSEKLIKKIDFPRLRESIKANLNANIAVMSIKNEDMPDTFELFGANIASLMLESTVDRYVTEEMVTTMMQQVNVDNKPNKDKYMRADDLMTQINKASNSMYYDDLNHFVVVINAIDKSKIKIMLERTGLFNWVIYKVDFGNYLTSISKEKEPNKVISFPLETFVVNLADNDGSGYLVTNMELTMNNRRVLFNEISSNISEIRDVITAVLQAKRKDEVNSPHGQLILKKDLILRINSVLKHGKIHDIRFMEFKVN